MRAGQGDDVLGRNPADRRCPGGILRLAIAAPEQILLEHGIADAEALQKRLSCRFSVASVCARPSISAVSVLGTTGSQSACASCGRSSRSGLISTKRAPRCWAARMAPRSTCRLTPPAAIAEFFSAMPPNATTISVCAAICSHVTPRRPTASIEPRMWGSITAEAPADVRVHRTHIATEHRVQEPVQLSQRMMEPSGAGPTVRAAEDRTRSMRIAHARKFIGQQVERAVPRHRDERIAATPVVSARAVLQPTTPHHRTGDAGLVAQGVGEIFQDAVWIGVGGMRTNLQAPIRPAGTECAPVCAVGAPVCRLDVLDHSTGPFTLAGTPPSRRGWPAGLRPPRRGHCQHAAPFRLAAPATQDYPNAPSSSPTCPGVRSRGEAPRSSRNSFAASSSSSAA